MMRMISFVCLIAPVALAVSDFVMPGYGLWELTNRLSDMGELEAESVWNQACRDHVGRGVRSDFGWIEDRRAYGLYCHAPGALEGSDKTEDTVKYLNTKVQPDKEDWTIEAVSSPASTGQTTEHMNTVMVHRTHTLASADMESPNTSSSHAEHREVQVGDKTVVPESKLSLTYQIVEGWQKKVKSLEAQLQTEIEAPLQHFSKDKGPQKLQSMLDLDATHGRTEDYHNFVRVDCRGALDIALAKEEGQAAEQPAAKNLRMERSADLPASISTTASTFAKSTSGVLASYDKNKPGSSARQAPRHHF
ncbi:hypothetical protein IE81DRAFT_360950 [Ceraceosorus guamensis]|uniref:Uncharacterized protein n=1 Tax=Ceraceosorus guamensis TaxID=1522189 RepID=A0A316VSY6_9BASI|nr:hypothetical protein IE81DRAFT_360950 [Ceraceosorus guamensis]PWN40602.1 hypothetical protein IE81DRAFT_360950 [Ceraceosorus guamensis]